MSPSAVTVAQLYAAEIGPLACEYLRECGVNARASAVSHEGLSILLVVELPTPAAAHLSRSVVEVTLSRAWWRITSTGMRLEVVVLIPRRDVGLEAAEAMIRMGGLEAAKDLAVCWCAGNPPRWGVPLPGSP